MSHSIWDKTYRNDRLAGLPAVSILTAIHGDLPLDYTLVADFTIRTSNGPVDTVVTLPLSPSRMRALAALLTQAADRVEDELLPLLDAGTPEIIAFTLEPQAEAA